jgi:predicted membrane protein
MEERKMHKDVRDFRRDHHGFRKECKKGNKFKSLAFAIIILSVGVLLLLKNTGILTESASAIIFTWQMLIIALGFINLWGRSFLFGIFLMLIGGFFMGADYWGITYEIQNLFWPIILIFAGFSILLVSFGYFKKKRFSMSNSDENHLEEISVFGGTEKSFSSKAFKGGKLIAVFGGSKIDLRDAQMEDGNHILEVVMVFGGTSLIIPPDWNVKSDVFNVFGGFSDKRRLSEINTNKTLIIKGIAIFGGGELKN